MPLHRLAVVLESLQRPLRQALDLAATLGVTGVQFAAVGPLAPAALSQTGRRELSALLRARGLALVALDCPLAHGFDTADGLDARLGHVKQVLTLAYDLGAGAACAIVHAGRLDLAAEHPAYPFLRESLTDLGRHGARVGALLALEAAVEPPDAVTALLARFDTGGLGIHFDPASLLMQRQEPVAAIHSWGGRIVYVQARDAKSARADRSGQEVPLGAGDIDWSAVLGALEQVEYRGPLAVKRGLAADPVGDVRAGLDFLRRLTGWRI